ncbi:MAG: hypothetical protein KJ621_16075 [Proteobacteria bacterium]|nr:hypothetical protein [Pseudomonadota bacterium]MBU1741322.1 hypothetical protein [Pseudomonadota bacterium]
MKLIRCLALSLALVLVGLSGVAAAKCYRLHYTPAGYYFCYGRNGSDSWEDRQQARRICAEILADWPSRKKCGAVSSHASFCHSNSGRCYDENGNAHRDLKGY